METATKMRTAISLSSPVGGLREVFAPFELLEVRSQRKTVFLAMGGDSFMPYPRFKALTALGEAPREEAESAFMRRLEVYLETLKNALRRPTDPEPRSLASFIEREIIPCLAIDDPLERLVGVNSALLSRGLPALRKRWACGEELNDEGILRYLREAPLTPKEWLAARKPVTASEAKEAVRAACLGNGVEAAYVYGSFATGTQTSESDIDVCFLPKKGHTERERASIVQKAKQEVEARLCRICDSREAVSDDPATLGEILGQYEEAFP